MDRFRKKMKSFNHRSVMEMESELNRFAAFLKKMGDQAASNIKMEFLQQRLCSERNLPELFCDCVVDYLNLNQLRLLKSFSH